jgi:DNA-directed RNA polymerase subunit L/DNA-directed RNA polymerase alpha subunit
MFHEYVESGPSLLGNTVHKLGARFRLAPSNVVIANTIRRQVMSAVKTVGFRTEPAEFSEVVIETNTTPLVNEMLAHRIGMIPIRADPTTFDPSRFEFRISKENAEKSMMSVSAADFQVIERDPSNPLDEGTLLPTESFFPPDPITGETALITRLRPQWNPIASNEKLVLKARAAVSSGAENSRWCPVSQCSYEYTRDDNPERIDAMFESWMTVSKKIVNVAELGEDRLDELRREYNTMEIQRCFRVDERGEPNDFTFYMESVGILPIPEIIAQALQATIDMLSKYQDIDGELPDGVQVQAANTRFSAVDLIFANENHTLGNLLQHYLVANHIDGAEDPKITFAGYKVPHPLKKEMVVCVGVQENEEISAEVSLQTARFVVAKVVRHCKEIFKSLLADWKRAMGQPDIPDSVEKPTA